jgi:hypothetical protein
VIVGKHLIQDWKCGTFEPVVNFFTFLVLWVVQWVPYSLTIHVKLRNKIKSYND